MEEREIQTISPATNQVVVKVQAASITQIQHVVERSTAAFEKFRNKSFEDRLKIVRDGLALIQQRKQQLAEELTMQIGRPISYSAKEIETMQKRADYLIDIAQEALKDIPGTEEPGFRRFVRKEPRGPTLAIFAWNFPWLIVVSSLVPALLTGNTVILKPSPQTPLVGERLVEIFTEAGLPADVLQCVQTGSMETLQSMARMPEIASIVFTGSPQAGMALRRATADRIVPLSLELGGKDPAYVRHDCDIRYVAEQIVDGAVFNAGQSCCSVERVYVHEKIYKAFLQAVKDLLMQYNLADPMDRASTMGPVISRAAQKQIEGQISEAISQGAVDATPLNPSFREPPADGNYVPPRLLLNVTHDMDIMRKETFGPVIPVVKVRGDDEAVALMNDSDYGLSASVWTQDIAAGGALVQRLDAGTVFVNRADYPTPDLAWTGWKTSGLGSSMGPEAYHSFYKLKSYHIKERQG